MNRLRLIAVGAVTAAAALAAPAGASAAALALDHDCYIEGGPITLSGSGYDPNAAYTISDSVSGAIGNGTTDATGAFTTTLAAPSLGTQNPVVKVFHLTAAEDANPAQTAPIDVSVTDHTVGITPARGKPTQKVTYKISGYTIGAHIYGHYRYHNRTVKTADFGVAAAPCGTRTLKARRIPAAHPAAGTWKLQIDSAKKYKAARAGAVIYRIVVTRTFHF